MNKLAFKEAIWQLYCTPFLSLVQGRTMHVAVDSLWRNHLVKRGGQLPSHDPPGSALGLINNFVISFPCLRKHSSKTWTDQAMAPLPFRAVPTRCIPWPQLNFCYFAITPLYTPVTLLPPVLSSWLHASVRLPAIQGLLHITIRSWQCTPVVIKFYHYCSPLPVTLANTCAHTQPFDEHTICLMA